MAGLAQWTHADGYEGVLVVTTGSGDGTAGEPGLTWSIKRAFTDYVTGRADGVVEATGGAVRRADGTFRFPPAPSPGDRERRFRGTVTCTGHHGMLVVRWTDPAVVERDGRRWLTCADEDAPDGRLTFLELPGAQVRDGALRCERPVLTAEGADLFFGDYRPGTPFDPLLVVAGTGTPRPAEPAGR